MNLSDTSNTEAVRYMSSSGAGNRSDETGNRQRSKYDATNANIEINPKR